MSSIYSDSSTPRFLHTHLGDEAEAINSAADSLTRLVASTVRCRLHQDWLVRPSLARPQLPASNSP